MSANCLLIIATICIYPVSIVEGKIRNLKKITAKKQWNNVYKQNWFTILADIQSSQLFAFYCLIPNPA